MFRIYDRCWDKILNSLLDNNEIVKVDSYTIVFRTGEDRYLQVWVGNYPYAYGYPYSPAKQEEKSPSRKTKKRLSDVIAAWQSGFTDYKGGNT